MSNDVEYVVNIQYLSPDSSELRFKYSTYLHCRVPRVKCSNCGILQIEVPWTREQSHFTLQMEATILELAKRMPVLQVGNLLGEHDTRLWSCLLYTSDAADDLLCVDLGGRRIIKKKKKK